MTSLSLCYGLVDAGGARPLAKWNCLFLQTVFFSHFLSALFHVLLPFLFFFSLASKTRHFSDYLSLGKAENACFGKPAKADVCTPAGSDANRRIRRLVLSFCVCLSYFYEVKFFSLDKD